MIKKIVASILAPTIAFVFGLAIGLDFRSPFQPGKTESSEPEYASKFVNAFCKDDFDELLTHPFYQEWGQESVETEFKMFSCGSIKYLGRVDNIAGEQQIYIINIDFAGESFDFLYVFYFDEDHKVVAAK